MTKKTVSGTKEWSASSENCYEGCSNNCWYCYARADASRFNRREPGEWEQEKQKALKNYGKRKGVVMFPTTHDITISNLDHCLETLHRILKPGNQVLIVSKPNVACIDELCRSLRNYQEQILFRFTIGSMYDKTLKFWEPGAPNFHDRVQSLRLAHRWAYKTSVSMEPMLDHTVSDILGQVAFLQDFVTDAIWLGRANNLAARLTLNGAPPDVVAAGQGLMEAHDDLFIHTLYDAAETQRKHSYGGFGKIGFHKLKYKESIKKVVGLEVPTEAGLDI
jgi:hypothetical protein